MVNLHDVPVEERPRERLIKYGVEVLSISELLALIFGRGTRNEPVMTISHKLLSKFGSLFNLQEASLEDLMTIKGIGIAKACQIKACFEIARRTNNNFFIQDKKITLNKHVQKGISPDEIYRQVRQKLINFHKEHLIVISLNSANKIIGIDIVSIGILNSNLVHPREVFKTAINHHAAQIILCHNHPSNVLIPSDDDLEITKDLVSAGNILGIEVIDHIIITKNEYYSFKENKLI